MARDNILKRQAASRDAIATAAEGYARLMGASDGHHVTAAETVNRAGVVVVAVGAALVIDAGDPVRVRVATEALRALAERFAVPGATVQQ